MAADVSQTVVYRFDVESNSIPLEHFIGTAESTQKLLDNFSEELFGKKGQFELYIIAPEPGSFTEKFKIVPNRRWYPSARSMFNWMAGVAGVAVIFVTTSESAVNVWESETVEIYIEELTGHKPNHWIKILAEKHKGLFLNEDGKVTSGDVTERIFVDKNGKVIAVSDDGVERTIGPAESAKIATAIMGNLTTRFMETEVSDLEKMGFGQKEFWEAYSGKNQMYQACESNREVRGIEFSESGEFSIKRGDFQRHIVADLPEKKQKDRDELQKGWVVEIVNIYVYSPNWRGAGRMWQGIMGETTIRFHIEDIEFWQHVGSKTIEPAFGDALKVQLALAYVDSTSKRPNYRVLKVLDFNGKKISDPLDEERLSALLGDDFHDRKADELDLFD